jgi:hypothetical protein
MLRLALLCHLSAVSAQQRLAVNVQCLPIRSDEALLDFSGANLLHNNLGGVAAQWCASDDGKNDCSSDMSLLPNCTGKTIDDPCYEGVGALTTNQRSPRWDRPASAPTASRVVCSLRKRLRRRE